MQLTELKVLENEEIARNIYALKLTGDFPWEKVKAGQFVHLQLGSGLLHPLRRPFSLAAVSPKAEELTLAYRVVGSGTEWLSKQKRGCLISALGPLGSAFPLPEKGSRVLIVGGGVGIPPLLMLAAELKTEADIVLGFQSRKDSFWLKEFSHFGKVKVTTEDGSLGQKGFVTEALKGKKEWDYLYACGPKAMLRALKRHFEGSDIKGYVSLEERMACGVGACAGCACPTASGTNLLVCQDGPVFSWEEVAL
ncbi:MAG TPA: dihydroorotate dehydrogenase electron transfer subunit [Firmicutes bacterium]|nr:dihydroorotate dehydrogenase electron transfer subunit [Bacillota bacterium]